MPPLTRPLSFLCALLAAGCASVAPSDPVPAPAGAIAPAVIHFHAAADPGLGWMKGSTAVQWGLLFTHDDLVAVKENQAADEPPTLINSPRYAEPEFLNRMATLKGIPNGESRTLSIEPGTYDWLVLIDMEGDGAVDGYLGTLASQGPLSAFEFLPGKQYSIDVDSKGALAFRIEGDAARDAPERESAVYLALVDAVSARLAYLDDALLRDYVGLVVDEIDALRGIEGDLCYDLIQGEDDEGTVGAYQALPAQLKVRESAILDRVLRAKKVSRPTASQAQAEAAMDAISERLAQVYGEDVDIAADDDLFAENKDLGCSIHRDMLVLMLQMPLAIAAPLWRQMFLEEDVTQI